MRQLVPFVLVLALAGLARGDDSEVDKEPTESSSEPVLNLASHRGLTGMREMIDARTPAGLWHIRVGAFFQGSDTETSVAGDIRSVERQRFEFTSFVGASFLGHLEIGWRWPFPEFEHIDDRLHDPSAPTNDPWPSTHHTDTFAGGGNPSLSAKAGWTLGPVSLAAYAIGQTGGSRHMTHKEDTFGELGGAGTISFANGLFAVHLNLSGLQLASRHLGWEFRYRTGFSFVVVASETLAVRTFIYGDGQEAEGSRGSDYWLGAGLQFQFGERFQLELTGDGRIIAGQLQSPFRDEGTYSVAVGAAFIY
jgi:hypothetical protein